MLIPRHWAKTNGSATDAEGKEYAFHLRGWSQESRMAMIENNGDNTVQLKEEAAADA